MRTAARSARVSRLSVSYDYVEMKFVKMIINIARDRFETDSVNVIKDKLVVAKKHKEISVYIKLAQSQRKNMKIVIRKINTQNFRNPWRFMTNW